MIYPRLAWIVSLLAIIFATAATPRFVRGEGQSTSIKASTWRKGRLPLNRIEHGQSSD